MLVSAVNRRWNPGKALSRPWAVSISALALVATLTASCAGSSTSSSGGGAQTLTVGFGPTKYPTSVNSIVSLAESLGYYKKYGVNVKIDVISSTPALVVALQSGSVDVANIDPQSLLEVDSKGKTQFKAVDSTLSNSGFVIVGNSSIKSPADLVGKTFAIDAPGSEDDDLTVAALKTLHVDSSRIHFVTIGAPADRATALVNGRVDATTVSIGTYQSIANSGKAHIVLNAQDFFKAAPILGKVNAATVSTIKKKSKAIQDMVTAQIAAARAFAKNPDLWSKGMATGNGEPVATFQKVTPHYTGQWCTNGCLVPAQLAATLKFVYSTDSALKGQKVLSVNDVVDFSFTDAANKKLGSP